jgi:dipeptidyl aminopeptidase/acylaminoacyl peptidase
MRVLPLPLLLALTVVAVPRPARADAPGPAKSPLTIADLYRLDGPTAPVLSPDGRRLVYVRTWIDPEQKRERHALWLAEEPGKARPLEPGEPDGRAPTFSPDGRWIAFLSTRPRPAGWPQVPPTPPESDPATDVWLLPVEGGSAVPLAGPERPYGRVFNDGFYGRIAFSPDGKQLALVADDGKDPRTPAERSADVRVGRPDGGEGYTGYGPAHVWLARLDDRPGKWAASRITRLTADDFWYGDPQWSPDGKYLVVHANRTTEQGAVRYSINHNYDLWALDPDTRRLTQLTRGPGPEVSPRFAPDGKRLVCLSVPRRGSHRDAFNLAIVTLDPDGPHTRVLFDHLGPGADHPLHPAPAFPLPDDCWDGADHLIYNAEIGTHTRTFRLDLKTAKAVPLPDTADGSPDTVAGRRERRRRLTPAANAFLKDRLLGETRLVSWDNGAGRSIEGLLTLPPPAVAPPPCKLLLYPHGGPHSRSTAGFDFTVQLFAAHGYAVFQPNYRGSSGYGQKFIDADRFDFGGGDAHDILTGIDHLVKEGLADADRLFVYGTSYGGFLTCWLVGHTTRFRAAAAQNAVTDLTVMWGVSDISNWVEWEVGDPWKNPDALHRHSPLTYADQVRTPTLVLHSRDDRRVPLPNGVMFYHALKAHGVPTEMVIYPGEGHGIRQPRHREDVLRRVLAWFGRYETERARPAPPGR